VTWAVISYPFLFNCSGNTFPGNGYGCNERKRVLSTWSAPRSYKGENWWQPSHLIFGSQFYTVLEHRSRKIAIVNTNYQATSSENTEDE
jgi:hypothetical protein